MPAWQAPDTSMQPRQVAFWQRRAAVQAWLPLQTSQAAPPVPQPVISAPLTHLSPLQQPAQFVSLQLAVPPASVGLVLGKRHRPSVQTSVLRQVRQVVPLPPHASVVVPN